MPEPNRASPANPLRVVFVASADFFSGAERVLLLTAESLVDAGRKPFVVVLYTTGADTLHKWSPVDGQSASDSAIAPTSSMQTRLRRRKWPARARRSWSWATISKGCGATRRDAESRIAAFGLGDHFRFLGFRPNAPALIACFDIVAVIRAAGRRHARAGLQLARTRRHLAHIYWAAAAG